MMKKKNILTILIVMLLIVTFSKSVSAEPINIPDVNISVGGETTSPQNYVDNIKLLQDSVCFSADTDSVVIRTGERGWILYGFGFYETIDSQSQCGYYSTTLDEKKESKNGVDVEYEWLKVYVLSQERVIKIRVDRNTTGKTRYWKIELGHGNFFDRVYCIFLPLFHHFFVILVLLKVNRFSS